MKPRLLDCGCKGGGASRGYDLAGYEVTGIDIESQPKYPYRFIQADMFEFLAEHGHEYDLIHASPFCERYSSITKTAGTQDEWPDQIPALRELLKAIGKPYVIENVETAPLTNVLMLCGTMFGRPIVRHRLFECNPPLFFPPAPCCHSKRVVKHGRRPDRAQHFAAVTGHFSDVAFAQEAMEIDWLGQAELAQAIPPYYTEYVGRQMIANLPITHIIDLPTTIGETRVYEHNARL